MRLSSLKFSMRHDEIIYIHNLPIIGLSKARSQWTSTRGKFEHNNDMSLRKVSMEVLYASAHTDLRIKETGL